MNPAPISHGYEIGARHDWIGTNLFSSLSFNPPSLYGPRPIPPSHSMPLLDIRRYYGGFIFLEEEASLNLDGAYIEGNHAGDQGGGLYARDTVQFNATNTIVTGNTSPQGSAAYLTHVQYAKLEGMNLSANEASSGSSVFIAESTVTAREIIFSAGNFSASDLSNRALQTDSAVVFRCDDCTFDGWVGETVVNHGGDQNGSLELNNCDFRESSGSTMVVSSYSYSVIRNAKLSKESFANAQDPLALVDKTLSCDSVGLCGAGECTKSSFGVLCECLPDEIGGACSDNGPTLLLDIETPPSDETFSPNEVTFDLSVTAGNDGSTDAIWELTAISDELDLVAVPSSGVMSQGETLVIQVSGTPRLFARDTGDLQLVGGNLSSNFELFVVGYGSSTSEVGASDSNGSYVDNQEVISTLYLCDEFEVAMPANVTDTIFTCDQCSGLDGQEGVDCEDLGATLYALPILSGFWRSDIESSTIHPCFHGDACSGATHINSSDDYCASGYVGPCEFLPVTLAQCEFC